MGSQDLRWLGLLASVAGLSGACASGTNPTLPSDAGNGARADASSGSSSSGGSGGRGDSGSSSGATMAEASAPAAYRVAGRDILDANGNKHLFRGVARPSFEFNAQGENPTQSDVDALKSWGANVVRIALNQDFWISDPSNAHYDSGYADNVDQFVQLVRGSGLDVILDLHWSDGGSFSQSPGQWCMADQNSLTFWKQVANKYKGDTHVLLELYNEPYVTDWNLWLSGGMTTCSSFQNNNGTRMTYSATFMVAGMQQLYDAVRGAGAQNLVIVGGIGYAFDLSGVGQGHRVKDASGNNAANVIYNTHPYNQNGKTTPSEWFNAFGYLAATDPVIATEFGDGTSSTCNTGNYDSSILPYFDAMGSSNNPANRISWTAWAWYPGGCQFPSLINDWPTHAATPSGAVVKAALQSFKQP